MKNAMKMLLLIGLFYTTLHRFQNLICDTDLFRSYKLYMVKIITQHPCPLLRFNNLFLTEPTISTLSNGRTSM